MAFGFTSEKILLKRMFGKGQGPHSLNRLKLCEAYDTLLRLLKLDVLTE